MIMEPYVNAPQDQLECSLSFIECIKHKGVLIEELLEYFSCLDAIHL